jgi:nucleoside-diphosphate-sugar epimerase
MFTLIVVTLTWTLTSVMADSNQVVNKEKVLVFGGNGFIGSDLVSNLIQKKEYDIYIVSRGNWYFDSEQRIKPFVTNFICDRENSDLDYCTELMNLIETTEQFKYVFDFSAYKPEVLEASVEVLQGKVGLYVYISTDSVYEVCENKTLENNGLSREIDAIRPKEEHEIDRLNELDEYGNEKLSGEEVITGQRTAGGIPYLIVRLPDVLGPRDTTERIWTYIMWIQFYDFIKIPIYIPPPIRDFKCSFVYVKDVTKAIFHLLDKGVKDEIYNIGFDQVYTLEELIRTLAGLLGQNVQFDYEDSRKSFNFFPSVSRGGIDTSKLKETGFTPTDFLGAMNETIEFYKEAFYTHTSERDDVIHQMTKLILGRERKGEFLKYIDRLTHEREGLLKFTHTEL